MIICMIVFMIVGLTIFFVFSDFATYCLGKYLYKIGFTRYGFILIAKSLSLTFGKCHKQRKWLFDNCPYNHCCENCRLWTCPGYDGKDC